MSFVGAWVRIGLTWHHVESVELDEMPMMRLRRTNEPVPTAPNGEPLYESDMVPDDVPPLLCITTHCRRHLTTMDRGIIRIPQDPEDTRLCDPCVEHFLFGVGDG